jgi:hypothetical protein
MIRRDAVISILQSSTTCWAILIRDYGVVGTLSASASLTLVLIVAIAMHKAILFSNNSRTGAGADSHPCVTATASKSRSNTGAEKKRRRRKGHSSSSSSNKNRIKGGNNGSSNSPSPIRLPKVEEVASDGAGSDSSTRSSSYVNASASQQLRNIFDEPKKQSTTLLPTASCLLEEEAASIMTSTPALESVVNVDALEGKARVPSVCTVDTTSMSDDNISCGSFSVLSGIPPPRPMRSVNAPPPAAKGKVNKSNTPSRGNNNGKGKNNNQRGTKQTNLAGIVTTIPVPNISRAEGLKNAKPVPKHAVSPNCTTNPTSEPHVYQSAGGKGRKAGSQSYKGGRPLTSTPQPKNLLASRTVSPAPTTCDITSLVSTTPSTVINPCTISSGSPASAYVERRNNRSTSTLIPSNENNESRLPPFSPYAQSLFSCELGASQWSLPALPVVSQSKNVAAAMNTTGFPSSPALSYTSDPFVMPYRQMPSECNGSATSDSQFSSLSPWNNSSVQTNNKHSRPPSLGNLSTPPRPLRPPPGLPAPPGFASKQPILFHHNNNSDNNGSCNPFNETPSLMLATPSFGTPSAGLEVSSGAWNGADSTSGSPSAFMMTMNQNSPVAAKNPFARDSTEVVDWRIEAELQELGGRMIGSVLDGL